MDFDFFAKNQYISTSPTNYARSQVYSSYVYTFSSYTYYSNRYEVSREATMLPLSIVIVDLLPFDTFIQFILLMLTSSLIDITSSFPVGSSAVSSVTKFFPSVPLAQILREAKEEAEEMVTPQVGARLLTAYFQWLQGSDFIQTVLSDPLVHFNDSPLVQYFSKICSKTDSILRMADSLKPGAVVLPPIGFESQDTEGIELQQHILKGIFTSIAALLKGIQTGIDISQSIMACKRKLIQFRLQKHELPVRKPRHDCCLFLQFSSQRDGTRIKDERGWEQCLQRMLKQLSEVIQFFKSKTFEQVMAGLASLCKKTVNQLSFSFLIIRFLNFTPLFGLALPYKDLAANTLAKSIKLIQDIRITVFLQGSIKIAVSMFERHSKLNLQPLRFLTKELGLLKLKKIEEEYFVKFYRKFVLRHLIDQLLCIYAKIEQPVQQFYSTWVLSVLLRAFDRQCKPLAKSLWSRNPQLVEWYQQKKLTVQNSEKVGPQKVRQYVDYRFMVALKIYFEATFHLLPRFDFCQDLTAPNELFKQLFQELPFLPQLSQQGFKTALSQSQKVSPEMMVTVYGEASECLSNIHQIDSKLLYDWTYELAEELQRCSVKAGFAAMFLQNRKLEKRFKARLVLPENCKFPQIQVQVEESDIEKA